MMSTDPEVPLIGSTSSHQDRKESKERRRIKLYRAALRGDCKYKIHPDDITAKISKKEDTALHIGAMGKSCKFARKLLPKLDRLDDLVVRNKSGNTAFCLAAASGKLELTKEMIEVAKEMVKEKKYENLKEAMIKVTEEKEYGSLEEVEMMEKNGEYLAQVTGNNGMPPLLLAVLYGREEMVYWLYYLTKDSLKDDDRIVLLLVLIKNGFHELALQLLEEHKELATAYYETEDETKETEEKKETKDETKETALHVLAQLPIHQGDWKRIKKCYNRYYTLQLLEKYNEETISNQQGLWEKIKKCFNRFLCSIGKQSPEMKLLQRVWELAMSSDQKSDILKVAEKQIFVAAKRGNIEFLKILINGYPDLIFQSDDNWPSIFHLAVKHRHEDIFRLIHEIGSFKDFIVPRKDEKDNTILHLAAKLPPSERLHSVSGVALQMQRELLWFEEVKKLVNPFDAEPENNQDGKVSNKDKNKDGNSVDAEAKEGGKTLRALFSEKHKELKEDGEKWMKHTANYCMVVAALITAMVFAAILAVPGGISDETGTPHFLRKRSFKIFIVSDAVSLVLSTCSILSFLSILTSRYAEEDFLKALPTKLLFGLGTLLLSIAAMMVAFCAAIFILFKDGVIWIPILVAAIGSLSVIFSIQLVCLFIVVFRSTYISSSIFKPGKGTLFFENGKAMKS